MKTTLLQLLCLFVLAVGPAESSTLFARGTIERLSIENFRIDLTYRVIPGPYDPIVPGHPEFNLAFWDYISPREAYATLTGNFSPSPYLSPYEIGNFGNLSVIVQPDDFGTLFLTVDAVQDWMFEKWVEGSTAPLRTYAPMYGQGNFFVALPQEIGTSSVLTETPELNSFLLLSVGLLPLGISLSKSKRKTATGAR